MITIGLAGKPNSGKSTIFKASTLADVEIASYPFTTIAPNTGIAYVKVNCPCQEDAIQEATGGKECGNCIDGFRFVPVELLDVAGLVRGAHEGRGLGNKFLDQLRQAEAIIHVVDASGGTDVDGNVVDLGSHDPLEDIQFFKAELNMWVYGLIKKNWRKIERRAELEGLKIERLLSEQLAGVGVMEEHVQMALLESKSLDRAKFKSWTDDDLKELALALIRKSKKMLIAANKADVAPEANIKRLKEVSEENEEPVIPCSAAAELALRTAAKNKIISYLPGTADFDISGDPSEKQVKGLEKIREFSHAHGGTGIQEILNRAVFELLDYVVAYPVEDEHKFSDSTGRILPDALLLKRGSTARDLAFAVHTDIGESYLYAVDARTKLRLGEKHALEGNDIVKIVSTK
ncbi:MAG TPA: redox-regulated ATPase YchF [Desulfobacteria bacterium]|nr:redox-regulated ATPase YchF [Desulfobacteria bacterium]